jgi:predicted permease
VLSDLWRDVSHATRLLGKAPAFAVLAITTLGLGVGANTAIFSVVHGLLLRPLPYHAPDRLVFVDGALSTPEGDSSFQLSYPELQDIAAQVPSFSRIAPWTTAWGLTLEGTEGAARLPANFVGRGYFDVLGEPPLLGRTFTPDDHVVGDDGRMVVMLSEGVWRQHFGGDPSIVGRDVRLQGRPFTIVGIMPARFYDVGLAYQAEVDVWVPLERAPALFGGLDLRGRTGRQMWGVARLADGVSPERAAQDLRTLSARLTADHPQTNTAFRLRAAALDTTFFADARRPLWLLFGGSIFVLLIGCANVANLLLIRSTARTREMAIRLAVGASRWRLVRQLLAESLVLAMMGGGAGVLMAMWLTPVLLPLSGIEPVAFARITIDGTVLALSAATALACGLLFGLAPVWRATRMTVRDAAFASGTAQVARPSRAAHWLAGVEVTAAFVLAAGAIIMLKSFSMLLDTDLGFRHERLLTARMELPQDRYGTPAARAQFGRQLRERLAQLPGVEDVVMWGPSMFARSTWVSFVAPEDQLVADHERVMVWRHSTNPGALAELGIPIVAGRDFSAADTLDAPPVAIVSQATAHRLWPGQDAVGRRFRTTVAGANVAVAVIGVAADARHRGRFRFSFGAAAHEPQLDLYLPFEQRPNGLVTIGIRTAGDPRLSVRAVTSAVGDTDPALSVYDIAPLDERMRIEESSVGFAALLLNLYGGLALLLAAIGVYGVLAANVASKRRELGIRSALGAAPQHLWLGVVREGVMVTGVAIACGLAITWAVGQSVAAWIFGVSPTDPWLLSGAALLLLVSALAASAIPARAAARIDPGRVLRIDP